MSDRLREGRATDMFKSAASGLGNFFGKSNKTEEPSKQGSPTTTQPSNQNDANQPSNQSAVKQPSNQNDATTASKQAKGTSADKGGGRVQPKAGIIDVRRATYGKLMLALKAAGITDQVKQKEYVEQLLTNIVIPYLAANLNARGINITDAKSKYLSVSKNPIKDPSGNTRVITLSEAVERPTEQEYEKAKKYIELQKFYSKSYGEPQDLQQGKQELVDKIVKNHNPADFRNIIHEIFAFKMKYIPEELIQDEQKIRDSIAYFSDIENIKKINVKKGINKENNPEVIKNLNNLESYVTEHRWALDKIRETFISLQQSIESKRNKDYLSYMPKMEVYESNFKKVKKALDAEKIIAAWEKSSNNEQDTQPEETEELEQAPSTNNNSPNDTEEDVADPPTTPGQKIQSLKNYSDQLNKIDKKVFPKVLGDDPVSTLSKLFAKYPELASMFGITSKISEAKKISKSTGLSGKIASNTAAMRLLKALAAEGIKISRNDVLKLSNSILKSTNKQQPKQPRPAKDNTKQQVSPATPATDEQQLNDVARYIESKAGEIKNANTLTDLYKIVYAMPDSLDKLKKQYIRVISAAYRDPAIFIKNPTEQQLITRQGGFRDKVVELAKIKAQPAAGAAQPAQPAAGAAQPAQPAAGAAQPAAQKQQRIRRSEMTPYEKMIGLKIDATKPIELFKGSGSLLQRMNIFLKEKGVQVSKQGFQDQMLQIVKDLVDQLKINGITNKQIQENFDFTQELLNETIVNRWKLLANIK